MEEEVNAQPEQQAPQVEQTQQPQDESVAQPTQEATEQPVEVSQETQQPVASEPEPTSEVQQVEQNIETEQEEEFTPEPAQEYTPPEIQPIDFNKLPRDANGDIDPDAFAQALAEQQKQAVFTATENARLQARREVAEQIQEEKLWQQAEEAHPELKTDKSLREMVKNQRFGEAYATQGKKFRTPKQIADELTKHLNSVKKEGVEQAQTNVKIQESATLDTASNQSGGDESVKIMQRMSSARNQAERDSANRDYLKSLIDSGSIKIE